MARRSALRRARLRASEADRDIVAARLYDATLEGRLGADELDERLGVALAARTYGELEPLVSDLPGPSGRMREARAPVRVGLAVLLAVLLVALGAVVWHRW